MLFKVGDYIHATLPSVINGKGENLILAGTIEEINKHGHLFLNSGMIVYPEHANIVSYDNVKSIFSSKFDARAHAMKNHPAGKGLL